MCAFFEPQNIIADKCVYINNVFLYFYSSEQLDKNNEKSCACYPL